MLNKLSAVPLNNPNRKADFVLTSNYIDADTIVFQIPTGYSIEFLPETIKLNSKFGDYQAEFKFKDGLLTYIRRVLMRQGQHPATGYNEWVDFRKKIVRADKNQVVFVKN